MASKKPAAKPVAQAEQLIRDRVVELRRVKTSELRANEKNWRLHPVAQRRALAESLERIGMADVLIAYHSERAKGALTLIDGHARLEETEADDAMWPTVVLDVTDEEADLLLLTLDPMTGMADADAQLLSDLLEEQHPGSLALEDLLHELRLELRDQAEDVMSELEEQEPASERTVPEMELQPYEHFDYVVLLCRNTYDWMALQDALGIEDQKFSVPGAKTMQIGRGRVVDAKRLLDLLGKSKP